MWKGYKDVRIREGFFERVGKVDPSFLTAEAPGVPIVPGSNRAISFVGTCAGLNVDKTRAATANDTSLVPLNVSVELWHRVTESSFSRRRS